MARSEKRTMAQPTFHVLSLTSCVKWPMSGLKREVVTAHPLEMQNGDRKPFVFRRKTVNNLLICVFVLGEPTPHKFHQHLINTNRAPTAKQRFHGQILAGPPELGRTATLVMLEPAQPGITPGHKLQLAIPD